MTAGGGNRAVIMKLVRAYEMKKYHALHWLVILGITLATLLAGSFTTVQSSSINTELQARMYALTGLDITSIPYNYSQNFDNPPTSMPKSGAIGWVDDSTVLGWSVKRTGTGSQIAANNGSSNVGNLYSYGVDAASDRALGTLGSGNASIGSLFYGVCFKNSTGSSLSQVGIGYTGEQWRNSAATAQTVAFGYQVSTTGCVEVNASGYTAVTALDLISPITGGTAGALNGNLAANQVVIPSTSVSVTIPNGAYITLRWSDPNHSGDDHGLAIDDFTFSIGGIADTSPTVSTINPTNGATNVPVNTTIALAFSEAVTTTDPWYTLQCPAGTTVAASAGGSGNTRSITPSASLPYSTTCTLTLTPANITDQDGTADILTGNSSFSFTTASAPLGSCSNLFFSEYIEGSSNNKAIEIYNGTGVDVNLGGYTVELYANGSSSTTSTLTLASQVLAHGSVYIIANSLAGEAISNVADVTSAVANFNGDDALVLKTPGGTVIDAIGQVGSDPGEQWGSDPVSTADNTIRRKVGATSGDGNPTDAFDPALEWDGYAIDTFDGLGSHTASCSMVDLPPQVQSTTPPSGGSALPGSSITVIFNEPVTTYSGWYTLECPVGTGLTASDSGSGTTYTIDPDSDLPNGATCQVTVHADKVTDLDGTPEAMTTAYTWNFSVNSTPPACSGTYTKISAIQGSAGSSPVAGSIVTTQGIVTADYQATGQLGGYFIESVPADVDADPATSEGMYVFNYGYAVNPGDWVRLTGTVSEYMGTGGRGHMSSMTQIGSLTSLTVCGTGVSVSPTTLTLPADAAALERLEGMLVTIPQDLTVQQNYFQGRFGQITLSANGRVFLPINTAGETYAQAVSRLIVLDDGSSTENPPVIPYYPVDGTFRAGDMITGGITGVLDQGEINSDPAPSQTFPDVYYRIHAVSAPTFSTTARPASPDPVGGTLRIAGYNVLNYFTTFASRGADNAFEFNRQRTKIIQALVGLNADVLGLIEMENNSTAVADLLSGLNAALGAGGTYTVIGDPPLGYGSDAIKVTIIYKTDKVTPVDVSLSTNEAPFTAYRFPVAQAFTENLTGEKFVVVVNHFKSKRCDGTETGGDAEQPEGVGCYNLTRTNMSSVLNSWVNSTLATMDPDVILLGDFNAYSLEAPITTLEGFGYISEVNTRVLPAQAYSFTFDGMVGKLDHALASAGMDQNITGAAIWHINTDEPFIIEYSDDYKVGGTPAGSSPDLYQPHAYRASDHDPVLVGFGNYDFSDLADSYGRAYHILGGNDLMLGSQRSADTVFDAYSDNPTDDGVIRNGTWVPGENVSLDITISGGTDGNRWLAGWMDWNNDGDFNDTGEQIINQAVGAGTTNFPLTVPSVAGFPIGGGLVGRFRVYASGTEPSASAGSEVDGQQSPLAALPGGRALGGEIEDYRWVSPTAVNLFQFQAASSTPLLWPVFLSVVFPCGVLLMRWRKRTPAWQASSTRIHHFEG